MLELNKIYFQNCLLGMKEIDEKSIDLIITDLPYGTTSCKWDSIIDLIELWNNYKRIIKENGTICLTSCQPFTTKLISSNYEWFKYCWIWKKPQGVDPFMSKIRPLNNYEDVCIFQPSKGIYNPQKTPGKPYHVVRDKNPRNYEITNSVMKPTETINNGDRLPTRILEFNQEKGLHPTQKPVSLGEYMIKTYTHEKDLILDNTCGSGSFILAAKNTNRNFIGFENNEEYFKIASERIGQTL